ncbi:MAG: DUF1559 domain-containing protein, partial [Isosphaeraceae bacterium]
QLGIPDYGGYYAVHTRLLPYLDQAPLFNSINFIIGTWPTETFYVQPLVTDSLRNNANLTALNCSLRVFLCPSDSGAFKDTGNNYRGNAGVGPMWGTNAEHPDSGNGLFPEIGPVRISQVSDGLSHTAAFSERLRGSGAKTNPSTTRDPFRSIDIVLTADDLLKACRVAAQPTNTERYVLSGKRWFWVGKEYTLYNHAQAPNGQIPDCTTGGTLPATGMWTARSWHYGGVNALMGDGSVRFITDSISTAVWRGLGTRNGGELVE